MPDPDSESPHPSYSEIIFALSYLTTVELDVIRDTIDKLHPRSLTKHRRLLKERTLEDIARDRRKTIVRALQELRDGKRAKA